jgi:hypothetical protein
MCVCVVVYVSACFVSSPCFPHFPWVMSTPYGMVCLSPVSRGSHVAGGADLFCAFCYILYVLS